MLLARALGVAALASVLVCRGGAQEVHDNLMNTDEVERHFNHHDFVKYFMDYAAHHGLMQDLSPGELLRYSGRFASKAMVAYKKMKEEGSLEIWGAQLERIIHGEAPLLTHKIIAALQNPDWQAKAYSWFNDLTKDNVKDYMGYRQEPVPDMFDNVSIEEQDAADLADAERRLGLPPRNFDSRQGWPQCTDTLNHVRDQGKCGSCWAQASAGSMDGRLCIWLKNQFHSWTSAGYMTSCYNSPGGNGCNGGDPTYALTLALHNQVGGGGVPTGGLANLDTCVPYWGTGDSLTHFQGAAFQAPPCPTICSNPRYQKTLGQDLFYPGGPVRDTYNMQVAKSAVYEGGPVPLCFFVYEDLMAYAGGYYDHRSGRQVGGHCVTMLGYEAYKGKDYAFCANSWGTSWGEAGRFKMYPSCCQPKWTLFSISSDQPALSPGSYRRRYYRGSSVITDGPQLNGHIKGFPDYDKHTAEADAAGEQAEGGTTSAFFTQLVGADCEAIRNPVALEELQRNLAGNIAAHVGIPGDYVRDVDGKYGQLSVAQCGDHAQMQRLVSNIASCNPPFANDTAVVYGVLDLPSWVNQTAIDALTATDKFKQLVTETVVQYLGERSSVNGIRGYRCGVGDQEELLLGSSASPAQSSWFWKVVAAVVVVGLFTVAAWYCLTGGGGEKVRAPKKASKKSRGIKLESTPAAPAVSSAVPVATQHVMLPTMAYQPVAYTPVQYAGSAPAPSVQYAAPAYHPVAYPTTQYTAAATH
eukprot:TRINITY_DN884_c0_g2_i1.p1 TRINITY_DN884_c0_g2~~TRINITY_DN884_c0_g2_i1.p1  ORF type:complete len:780 (+),score=137.67 TRINITY_DN884_c0_g2_i1:88-2340(+)